MSLSDIPAFIADFMQDKPIETYNWIQIEAFRVQARNYFWMYPGSRSLVTRQFEDYMKKGNDRLRNPLAERMFDHYLNGYGADLTLTMSECLDMATATVVNHPSPAHANPISIPYERGKHIKLAKVRPEWTNAVNNVMRDTSKRVPYKGRSYWNHDNGMIGNYRITYDGEVGHGSAMTGAPDVVHWRGWVQFTDRCDFDPDWNWQPRQRRNRAGERRTRIMYILNLGWDFNVVGPKIVAKHIAGPNQATLLTNEIYSLKTHQQGGSLCW